MARKWLPAVAVFGTCWLGLGIALSDGPKDGEKTAEASRKEAAKADITALAVEMNSSKFAAPSNQFRQGHVTPRQLDPQAIKAAAKGFTIQLPSKAPIPTPTIYKGKIYASGGFHSKEFYCFDAQSGKLVWAVNLDDDGPTSAVVEDDVVVFNTESCTIFALDAQTGKQLWSYWLGDPLTSTPTIAKGKVFTSYPAMGAPGPNIGPNQKVNPNQGPPPPVKEKNQAGVKPAGGDKLQPAASHALACIELKTGKILWQKWLDSDVMSAPVAIDGELYATSFAGTVYKFKQADGTIISAHRSRATSAPVIVGQNVYLTQRADTAKGEKAAERIAGLDRDKNERKFESAKREALYLDEAIQAQSKLGALSMKLDAANGFAGGAPQAANPGAAVGTIGQGNVSSMQAFQGSRILNDGRHNYNCMGDEIACTDPANGKTLWSIKLEGDLKKEGGFLASAPASAGGQVFVTTLQGQVLQIDPALKKVVSTFPVNAPMRFQPAIVNGRIYVGTMDGKIACIDTGNPRLTGWFTWGANAAHTNLAGGN